MGEISFEYSMSFFDSHHIATALEKDGKIISTNQQYKNIPNLKLLNPENVLQNDLEKKKKPEEE